MTTGRINQVAVIVPFGRSCCSFPHKPSSASQRHHQQGRRCELSPAPPTPPAAAPLSTLLQAVSIRSHAYSKLINTFNAVEGTTGVNFQLPICKNPTVLYPKTETRPTCSRMPRALPLWAKPCIPTSGQPPVLHAGPHTRCRPECLPVRCLTGQFSHY